MCVCGKGEDLERIYFCFYEREFISIFTRESLFLFPLVSLSFNGETVYRRCTKQKECTALICRAKDVRQNILFSNFVSLSYYGNLIVFFNCKEK